MFVINGVELRFPDQVHDVGELKRRSSPGLEQDREARRKVVDVRYVCQHVVGNDEVRLTALRCEFPGKTRTKEILNDRNPSSACRGSGARGRLDTGARDTPLRCILQERTVVGRNLDNVTAGIKSEAPGHIRYVAFAVGEPCARIAAEIGIVGVEEFFPSGKVFCLSKPALLADEHSKRIPHFRLVCRLLRKVRVGGRSASEIDEGQRKRCGAVSTLHSLTPAKSAPIRDNEASRGERSVMGIGQAMASAGSSASIPLSAAGCQEAVCKYSNSQPSVSA